MWLCVCDGTSLILFLLSRQFSMGDHRMIGEPHHRRDSLQANQAPFSCQDLTLEVTDLALESQSLFRGADLQAIILEM